MAYLSTCCVIHLNLANVSNLHNFMLLHILFIIASPTNNLRLNLLHTQFHLLFWNVVKNDILFFEDEVYLYLFSQQASHVVHSFVQVFELGAPKVTDVLVHIPVDGLNDLHAFGCGVVVGEKELLIM